MESITQIEMQRYLIRYSILNLHPQEYTAPLIHRHKPLSPVQQRPSIIKISTLKKTGISKIHNRCQASITACPAFIPGTPSIWIDHDQPPDMK